MNNKVIIYVDLILTHSHLEQAKEVEYRLLVVSI